MVSTMVSKDLEGKHLATTLCDGELPWSLVLGSFHQPMASGAWKSHGFHHSRSVIRTDPGRRLCVGQGFQQIQQLHLGERGVHLECTLYLVGREASNGQKHAFLLVLHS